MTDAWDNLTTGFPSTNYSPTSSREKLTGVELPAMFMIFEHQQFSDIGKIGVANSISSKVLKAIQKKPSLAIAQKPAVSGLSNVYWTSSTFINTPKTNPTTCAINQYGLIDGGVEYTRTGIGVRPFALIKG